MRNAFGKRISYGQIGSANGVGSIDINEYAGRLARQMHEAGEKSKIEQREKRIEGKDPDFYFIGRRRADGSVFIESVDQYDMMGVVSCSGKTEAIALANARKMVVDYIMARKGAKTRMEALERVAHMNFVIADVLDGTGLGSASGKIQVGSGS